MARGTFSRFGPINIDGDSFRGHFNAGMERANTLWRHPNTQRAQQFASDTGRNLNNFRLNVGEGIGRRADRVNLDRAEANLGMFADASQMLAIISSLTDREGTGALSRLAYAMNGGTTFGSLVTRMIGGIQDGRANHAMSESLQNTIDNIESPIGPGRGNTGKASGRDGPG